MNIRKMHLAAVALVSAALSAQPAEPPIACNMKALTAAQRKDLSATGERMSGAITASRELADGYAFHLDPARATIVDVAQWLDLWRRCCPFYEFRIDYHAADAGIWLSVTGRPGVKDYLPIDSPRLAAKLPKR
ncbi:MAG TPA: hypothetical protein VGS58_03445 [Candidatus Sulfopaludibacter sp.]|nr:hypothetical protein [Candidatus Sulfopaludibacter sp.]